MTIQYAEKITCAGALTETEPEASKQSVHITIVGITIRKKPRHRKSKPF